MVLLFRKISNKPNEQTALVREKKERSQGRWGVHTYSRTRSRTVKSQQPKVLNWIAIDHRYVPDTRAFLLGSD